MPILVLYKSKYGSTKQYAQWIGEALQAPVRSVDDVRDAELKDATTVIIGGMPSNAFVSDGWYRSARNVCRSTPLWMTVNFSSGAIRK